MMVVVVVFEAPALLLSVCLGLARLSLSVGGEELRWLRMFGGGVFYKLARSLAGWPKFQFIAQGILWRGWDEREPK